MFVDSIHDSVHSLHICSVIVLYLHLHINPVDEDSHVSINAWPVLDSATLTPASVSHQPPQKILRGDQRTPTVPLKKKNIKNYLHLQDYLKHFSKSVLNADLTRVHAPLQFACTDHGVGDFPVINRPAVTHLRADQRDLSLT